MGNVHHFVSVLCMSFWKADICKIAYMTHGVSSGVFYVSRADERPGFSVVEPRLRDYYYDIAQ